MSRRESQRALPELQRVGRGQANRIVYTADDPRTG